MFKPIVKAALFITGITSSGYAFGVAPVAPQPMPPVILSAAVDLTDDLILISGRHFVSSTPTVRLAYKNVNISQTSVPQGPRLS